MGHDLGARQAGERICFDHLCQATGCKDGQNAFFGKSPKILNCWVARFGGKPHIDSPPMGIAEKVVVAMRHTDRAEIDAWISKMLDSVPLRAAGGVTYFGPRAEFSPDIPEIVELEFEVNGQAVPGYAADLELFGCIDLMPPNGSNA